MSDKTPPELPFNNRELAAVLAALSYWQQQRPTVSHDPVGYQIVSDRQLAILDIENCGSTVTPLSNDEIDDLCVRLNTTSAAYQFNTDHNARNGELYPVIDRPPGYLGVLHNLAGIMTGEFRAPKGGEFYLSGAIPECYRALNDLSQKFNIVKLVYATPMPKRFTIRDYTGGKL